MLLLRSSSGETFQATPRVCKKYQIGKWPEQVYSRDENLEEETEEDSDKLEVLRKEDWKTLISRKQKLESPKRLKRILTRVQLKDQPDQDASMILKRSSLEKL